MRHRALSLVALGIGSFSLITSFYFFTKPEPLNIDVLIRIAEHGGSPRGGILSDAGPDWRKVFKSLMEKPEAELILLNAASDPCQLMDCEGSSVNLVKELVAAILKYKKSEADDKL